MKSNKLKFGLDGPDWPNREASRFVEAAGLTWHVQIMGQGPVILCLHSTGASSHSFAKLAKILSTDFMVVVPDLPGHGLSDMPPSKRMRLEDVATNVGALMEALGLKPHIGVGHAAGAAVIIQMCLAKIISPKRVVAINGALLPDRSSVVRLLSRLAKPLLLNNVTATVFAWLSGNGGMAKLLVDRSGSNLSPSEIALYQRLWGNHAHMTASIKMLAELDLIPLAHRLNNLDVPLVLAVGTADRAVAPDDAIKVNKLLPHAKVVALPGLGHLAHEEEPDKIAEIVSSPWRAQGPGLR